MRTLNHSWHQLNLSLYYSFLIIWFYDCPLKSINWIHFWWAVHLTIKTFSGNSVYYSERDSYSPNLQPSKYHIQHYLQDGSHKYVRFVLLSGFWWGSCIPVFSFLCCVFYTDVWPLVFSLFVCNGVVSFSNL